MSQKRRKFSPQFKAEAVQMVLETGKPIAEVARDLGVHDGTLGNWVATWHRDNPEPVPELSPVERARVSEMEAEIRRLRMENEFLKKAAAFFRQDAAVAERCAVIDAEKANYPIAFMCRLLQVPRSSFYAWTTRVESATAARRRSWPPPSPRSSNGRGRPPAAGASPPRSTPVASSAPSASSRTSCASSVWPRCSPGPTSAPPCLVRTSC